MGNDDGKIELASKDYDVSGKIMLIAIVVLFVIIIIMLCLHAYVRWHLLRTRRRQHLRRSHRPQFVFTVSPSAFTAASRGLRPSVISSLPVFTVSPSSLPAECAVCLSEFQNGETGRVLPQCNHTFHTDCIDMWFHSHSTCPLCRTLVERPCRFQNSPELVISVTEPGEGEVVNRSGPEAAASSSSVRVEEGESGCETQSAIRSPVSRILSFKKILSREKKGNVSGCVAESETE